MLRKRWLSASMLASVGLLLGPPNKGQGQGPAGGIDRLKFYIGTWAYSQAYDSTSLFPNGGHNAGRWTAQWGPGHLSVVSTFHVEGTVDTGAGMEIMTWDPKAGVYRDHAIWYDAPGQWEYSGQFQGDTLIYRSQLEVEGKHITFRSETRPLPGGGFTVTEYASVDGGPEQRVLRGTASRR